MKVLVTGATGTVGGEVVKALLQRGADVRALTRKQPRPGTFPGAVEIALGDLSDPVSVAEAIKGVDELFLLIGNVADEFTQALTAYGLILLRRLPSRKRFVEAGCLIRFCGQGTSFRMSANSSLC